MTHKFRNRQMHFTFASSFFFLATDFHLAFPCIFKFEKVFFNGFLLFLIDNELKVIVDDFLGEDGLFLLSLENFFDSLDDGNQFP